MRIRSRSETALAVIEEENEDIKVLTWGAADAGQMYVAWIDVY